MKRLDPAAPPCVCDPLIGMECGHHLGLTQRVRHEGFEPVARAVGWVPLAEVLAALRDHDAYALWALAQTHVDRYQPTELGASRREILARYLAERLAGSPS